MASNIIVLTQMLTKSIYTPLLSSDPAYTAIVDDLENIVTYFSEQYSEDEAILLYSKKEVYFRLATAVAPNYDLEAQFTKLTKSVRFDHYFKLIQLVQLEIDTSTSCMSSKIQIGEIKIAGRNGSERNYELDTSQAGSITLSNITASTVEMNWDVFDNSDSRFSSYEIHISKSPMYDPYENDELNFSQEVKGYKIFDIFKNKLRIRNLDTQTDYYILLMYVARSGRKTISVSNFTTI